MLLFIFIVKVVDKSTTLCYSYLVDLSTSVLKGDCMEERFETFTLLISSVGRCIRKIKTEEVSEYNLKSTHVSCLYYLYKKQTLTAKELSDICDEDKAAVSRSIEYLEKNDFIYCKQTEGKRYKSNLFLTEKGRRTARIIAEKIDKILEQASIGLSEENRLIFYRSLSLINDNLKKICELYGE